MAVSYFHFLLITVVLFIPRVDSLSCYKCTSEDSWDDCNSNATKITCPSGSFNCLTGMKNCTSGNVMITTYYKRCSAPNTEYCETSKADSPKCPPSGGWLQVDSTDCCGEDYCNCAGDQCSNPNPGPSHGTTLRSNRVMLGMSMTLILWLPVFIH
ncbi:hypothetical protein ACROYT_G027151 [Oculina patagonica]